MTIDSSNIPPDQPDDPGPHGTYGQGDVAPGARRNRLRTDQHFASRPDGASEVPDPFGEGGFAAGGEGPDGARPSGYGVDFGQLEASQRHEKQVCEEAGRKSGTGAKSSR